MGPPLAGAPAIFLKDSEFRHSWTGGKKYHLVAYQTGADRIKSFVGKEHFEIVATSGGKFLLTNVSETPASNLLSGVSHPPPLHSSPRP
jgi:hypothetical protein